MQDDLSFLEDLVFRCLECSAADGPDAVEAVLAEHPEHASFVRRRLESLQRAGLVGGAEGQRPERLGDFRLLEPLGGGGMGLVYRAVQESLGREVALKLIRPEQLYFPGARERFEREVEIVARLQHPGIVPVHTFGEDDGVPYFAMECVDGCTLADALAVLAARTPAELTGRALFDAVCAASGRDAAEVAPLFEGSYVDACLRVVREVAEALEHAHRMGVLHRDLKPSNVMVTPGGRVMLLDFGLSASEGTTSLTRSGAQLGSLPYLPPERVSEGAAFDRRADVYELGVVLYELLTLELPFQGKSGPELITEIAAARPRAVRARNRAVPVDAEVVCGVAMERDPARRYSSAGAFARDLTNVLERRPIAARRTSVALRARRWVQRHPGWAAAGLLALVAPSAVAVQQWRIAGQQRRIALGEAQANERLTEESQLAVRFLGKSLDAIQEVLVVLSDDEARDVPLLARKREDLLERALELYEELAAAEISTEGRAFDQLESQRLQALASVAKLYALMSRPEAAETYERVLDEAGARAARVPGDWQALAFLARAHMGLASLASLVGDVTGAAEHCAQGLAVLEDVDPRERFRKQIAMVLVDLDHERGKALYRGGDLEGALAAIERAREHADENVAQSEGDVLLRQHRTGVIASVGGLHKAARNYAEARAVLEEGLVEIDALEPESSAVVQLRDTRAIFLINLGGIGWETGELAQAELRYREALELQESLVRSFPEAPRRVFDLVNTLWSLGGVLHADPERREEGLAYAERAVAEQAQLVERFPEPRHISVLGAALSTAGALLVDLGRPVEAIERFDAAIEAQTRALEPNPRHPEFTQMLASHQTGRADALLALERWGDAADCVRKALAAYADWRRLRMGAGRFLRCAELAARDETLAESARAAASTALLDEALAKMVAAVDTGYADLADFRGAAIFEPLRAREEFLELGRRVEDAAAGR